MTTVVNNPPQTNTSGNFVNIILGISLMLVIGYLLVTYGIPALRQMQLGGPQINVPSTIDVNINQKSE